MKALGSRKGISTIFISFLVSTIVLAIFTYIFINIATTMFSNTLALRNIARYSYQHELAQLVINMSRGELRLINVGSSDIAIDKVIVRTFAGVIEIKDPLTVCNSNIIATHNFIKCDPNYEYLAVVTLDGAIIYPQTPALRAYTVKTNTTYIIPITFSIRNVVELRERFNVSLELIAKPYTRDRAQIGFRGIRSQHLLLLPPGQEDEFINASVKTESSGIVFGVAVIGYDPSWVIEKMTRPNDDIPPRFSIMIAGPNFAGQDFSLGETRITIGGRTYTLTGQGYRILINNFTGVIQIRRGNSVIACSSTVPGGCSGVSLPAIGAWYYGSTDSEINLRLYLNGFASYVARFLRMASGQSPTDETSYYPYLFVGDIDGNGVNDIVFITEDAYYGDRSRVNDRYRSDDLSDWSEEPLVLKLLEVGYALGSRNGSIDGRVYAGIALYMNIFFHDNSHPDEDQLRDIDRTDWVLRILLIDEYGNEYIVREYRYQEICNYHKTRVTAFGRDNYFAKISQSIYISIPPTGRFWIAIAFQDSYGSGNTNDADFTVGVEFIGAIPFYR